MAPGFSSPPCFSLETVQHLRGARTTQRRLLARAGSRPCPAPDCASVFFSCGGLGYAVVTARGLLIAVASLAADTGFRALAQQLWFTGLTAMACGMVPDQEPLRHQGSPVVTLTGLDPEGSVLG